MAQLEQSAARNNEIKHTWNERGQPPAGAAHHLHERAGCFCNIRDVTADAFLAQHAPVGALLVHHAVYQLHLRHEEIPQRPQGPPHYIRGHRAPVEVSSDYLQAPTPIDRNH